MSPKTPRHSLKSCKSFGDAILLGRNLLTADELQAIPVGSLVRTAGGAMGLWVGLSPSGCERVVYNAGDLLKAWVRLQGQVGDGCHTGRDFAAVERRQGVWAFYPEALALHDRLLDLIPDLEDLPGSDVAIRWARARHLAAVVLERSFSAEHVVQSSGIQGVRG